MRRSRWLLLRFSAEHFVGFEDFADRFAHNQPALALALEIELLLYLVAIAVRAIKLHERHAGMPVVANVDLHVIEFDFDDLRLDDPLRALFLPGIVRRAVGLEIGNVRGEVSVDVPR